MVYKHVVWGLVYLLVIGLPSKGMFLSHLRKDLIYIKCSFSIVTQ